MQLTTISGPYSHDVNATRHTQRTIFPRRQCNSPHSEDRILTYTAVHHTSLTVFPHVPHAYQTRVTVFPHVPHAYQSRVTVFPHVPHAYQTCVTLFPHVNAVQKIPL